MPLIEVEEETDATVVLDGVENTDEAEALELKGLMESATTPRTVNNKRHAEFRARLATFTPEKYFAMPLEVSPLICAVSGWQMRENSSLLECRTCEKLVAIKVPQHLSAPDKQKLCAIYQDHLWETHADHCPCRLDAKRFLQREDPNNRTRTINGLILPSALSRLLPQDAPSLVLLETCLRSSFRDRVLELTAVIKEYTNEKAQLSTDVDFYRADDCSTAQETPDDDTQGASLIRRVMSCCNIEKTPTHETAAALALLGWDIQDYNHGTKCPICFAQRPFEDNEVSPANRKRSKWNHVVESHRYFCPWVAGLPNDSSPLWKLLADRILDDDSEILLDSGGEIDSSSTSVDPSTQYFELSKLINAGVSRKRLKPSRSWNKS